jgi:hypothetical protein
LAWRLPGKSRLVWLAKREKAGNCHTKRKKPGDAHGKREKAGIDQCHDGGNSDPSQEEI